jgi:hypothetical protein
MSSFIVRIEREGRGMREYPVSSHGWAMGFAQQARDAADLSVRAIVLQEGVEIHRTRGRLDPDAFPPPPDARAAPEHEITLRISRLGRPHNFPRISLDLALSHAECWRRRTDRSVRIAVVVDGVEVHVVRGRHPIPKHHFRKRPPPAFEGGGSPVPSE